jgi:hypothetical protein
MTDMRTTILAYVIAFLSLLMIGTICVGVGMGGIAQALRVLVAIAHAIQPH